jgi:hypothetical protein
MVVYIGRGPIPLFCLKGYIAVKTALFQAERYKYILLRRSRLYLLILLVDVKKSMQIPSDPVTHDGLVTRQNSTEETRLTRGLPIAGFVYI